ncbi:hypothetical protein AAEX28_10160 [Lentisphaerota bacterium WC36G]|nr:hypothetical protein LJT99_13000 [Lentisphaerae bacterium WC36]
MKYTKLLFTLCVTFTLLSLEAEDKAVKLSPEAESIHGSVSRTNTSYEEAFRSARKVQLAGDTDYLKNLYSAAIIKYKKAIQLYTDIKTDSPKINEQINYCANQVFLANIELAKKAMYLGSTKIESKRFDEAVKFLYEAKRFSPANSDMIQQMIDDAMSKKKYVASKEEQKAESVYPGIEEKKEKIATYLAQGKALFAAKRYLEAKKLFEDVLIMENTNTLATYYLKRTVIEIRKQAYQRRDALHREAISEVAFNSAPPIPDRTYSGVTNSIETGAIVKTVETILQTKLRTIKISGVSIENQKIDDIIDFIRQQAKEEDPDGEGINIFTRFENVEAASTPTDTAVNTPDDEGDEGDFGDDFGGGDDSGGTSFDEEEGYNDEGFGDEPDAGSNNPIQVDEAAEFNRDALLSFNFTEEISLGAVIEKICNISGLKYKIESHAVVIAAPDVRLDDLETKVFPLEREAVSETSSSAELRTTFQNRGVKFPAGSQIMYDPRVSRLVATNTPEALRQIESIINEELNVEDPMVLISAKFIEISQDDVDALGFSWFINEQHTNPMNNNFRAINLNTGGNDLGGGSYVQGQVMTDNDVAFQGTLQAINNAYSSDVMSSPRVTTMNNREASIRLFEERYFPDEYSDPEIVTQTIAGSGGNAGGVNVITVSPIPDFDEAEQLGITLNVTPTINSDRYSITLDIQPVIQEFVRFDEYRFETEVNGEIVETLFQKAVIARRQLSTTVTVNDGETILIGGVIEDRINYINDKVPFLGDIPFFGRFFTTQGTESNKVNLLILLQCRLVEPDGSPVREREVRGRVPFTY